MFYAYNVSTILADLGVEVDTYGSSNISPYSDKRFLGITDLLYNNTQSMQPKKKPKNHQLTKRERAKNRKINGVRVKVEYTIGVMKTYARIVDAMMVH